MKMMILTVLVFAASLAGATHLRSGYITIKRLAPGSTTCQVTLTVYVNTGSEIRFGDGILSFGDGESVTTPQQEATIRPDLGPNVGKVTFTTTHTYPSAGGYLISYEEPNRNAGIINLPNSVETRFYVELFVNLSVETLPGMRFVAPAVFKASREDSFSLGLGVADSSDFRYQYALVHPKASLLQTAPGYQIPAGVSVNPFNGQFTWAIEPNALPAAGEYAFAVRIDAIDANSQLAASLLFDFQIILVDGGSGGRTYDKGNLDEKGRLYTSAKDSVKIVFESDQPQWTMSAYVDLPEWMVSMTTKDSAASGKYYKVNWLRFKNVEEARRNNPYVIVVRATSSGLGTQGVRDASYLFFTRDVNYADIITSLEPMAGKVKIFPNPFHKFLNVDLTQDQQVTILKVNGERVRTMRTEKGMLDLGDLSPGMYLVQVNGRIYRVVKN